MFFSTFTVVLTSVRFALAVNGGASGRQPFTYTAIGNNSVAGGTPGVSLISSSYQYTGFGAAESNLQFATDGSWLYSPAISPSGVGYAISQDSGNTWTQVLPTGANTTRTQPVFRVEGSRYFYWSSNVPGLNFQYSDDQGKTWTTLSNHFDQNIQDWAKLIKGNPVSSKLANGVSEIM